MRRVKQAFWVLMGLAFMYFMVATFVLWVGELTADEPQGIPARTTTTPTPLPREPRGMACDYMPNGTPYEREWTCIKINP